MPFRLRLRRQCFHRLLPGLLLAGAAFSCTPQADSLPERPPPPKVAGSLDGVVVAAQPLAAQAGARILEDGGNAADAAVAAAFVVSVVEPSMNSIGGRTQILIRRPDGAFVGIDATTQAPSTYDPDTAVQAGYGYPTVGVPGSVAGLARLLEEHGTMSLEQVMARAIALAEGGFRILPGEAARHALGAGQLAEFAGSSSPLPGGTASPGRRATSSSRSTWPGRCARSPKEARTPSTEGRSPSGSWPTWRPTAGPSLESRWPSTAPRTPGSCAAATEATTWWVPTSRRRGAVSIGILHVLENFDMSALDPDEWAALVGTAVAEVFARREGLGGTRRRADDQQGVGRRRWPAQIELPGVELQRAAALGSVAEPARFVAGRVGVATGAAPRDHDWDGSTWGAGQLPTPPTSPPPTARACTSPLTQTIGPNLGSKVATPGARLPLRRDPRRILGPQWRPASGPAPASRR